MKRKLFAGLMILAIFIAIYAAHIGLIAIGVPTRTAVALMVLAMGLLVIALIVAIDTLRADMNSRRESVAQQSESIPSNSDQ